MRRAASLAGFLTVFVTVSSLVAVAPAGAGQRKPLEVTPASGPPGTKVAATAGGTAPLDTTVLIYYSVSASKSVKICSVAIDNVPEESAWKCGFQIPKGKAAGAKGEHEILAKDSNGAGLGVADFKLT